MDMMEVFEEGGGGGGEGLWEPQMAEGQGMMGTGGRVMIDPFLIVPEVVLREHLLKYLEDPLDRLSLVRASPAVAKFLESSKMTLYSASVFSIPNFRNLFTDPELLHLRGICKDWQRSIDDASSKLLYTEPNFKSYKSIVNSPLTLSLTYVRRKYIRQFERFTPRLHNSRVSEAFMEAIKNGGNVGANPFVGKRVMFFPTFRDQPNFWNNTGTVLGKFGMGLHALSLFCSMGMTGSEVERRVTQCLELVPEISSLDCTFVRSCEPEPESSGSESFPSSATFPPPLPKLCRLHLTFGKVSTCQPFASYFDQLVSLHVAGAEDFMDWFDPGGVNSPRFPVLKHFAVYVKTEDHLTKLQSITTSPLRDLHIESGLINLCPSVYFHFVGHFRDTLATFRIHQLLFCDLPLKTLGEFELPEPDRIDFPHLKVFSFNIKDCGFGPIDDPLLKLSHSPEYLEIQVEECHGGDNTHREQKEGACGAGGMGEQALQIHGYWKGSMYGANVWRLLPALQELHVLNEIVQWKSLAQGDKARYSRGMYEQIIRRGQVNDQDQEGASSSS